MTTAPLITDGSVICAVANGPLARKKSFRKKKMETKKNLTLNLIYDLAGASLLRSREEHDTICKGIQEAAMIEIQENASENDINKIILRVISTQPWDPCDICTKFTEDKDCEFEDNCEENFRVKPELIDP